MEIFQFRRALHEAGHHFPCPIFCRNKMISNVLPVVHVVVRKWWKNFYWLINNGRFFSYINEIFKIKFQTNSLFNEIQAALVIWGLFTCKFEYMRLKNGLFSGTYLLIYSDSRSFYMPIHYIRAYFWSPFLSHLMRSTCT